jgi:hypothetical protein
MKNGRTCSLKAVITFSKGKSGCENDQLEGKITMKDGWNAGALSYICSILQHRMCFSVRLFTQPLWHIFPPVRPAKLSRNHQRTGEDIVGAFVGCGCTHVCYEFRYESMEIVYRLITEVAGIVWTGGQLRERRRDT